LSVDPASPDILALMPRLRSIAINLALVLVSTLACMAFFEFVVFHTILLPSDAPRLDFVDGIIRYAPRQEGVWRVRDEIAAPYRINSQGWNSGTGDYARDRTADVTRIAVIGDSYVEAFQVAYDASMAEKLGGELTAAGRRAEVYRFGIGGAPLSQYVHMAEREVIQYRPDWIVVNVVHNDFDESYRFVQSRYTSYFLKFRIEDGKVAGDLQPTPWRDGAVERLRHTATIRFFFHRWNLRPEGLINLLLMRRAGAAESPPADIEIDGALYARRDLEAVAQHAVVRLAAASARAGARLLIVMDGDRKAIYAGAASSPALELNRIMAAAAERHGIAFLDMHPHFAAHWAAHRQRLSFELDYHWNELAHSLVGAAVADHIRNAR